MSDRMKVALLSGLTSVIVALGSTGAIQATRSTPAQPSYEEDRALIMDKLVTQQRLLERIDARTRRLEISLARLQKGGR